MNFMRKPTETVGKAATSINGVGLDKTAFAQRLDEGTSPRSAQILVRGVIAAADRSWRRGELEEATDQLDTALRVMALPRYRNMVTIDNISALISKYEQVSEYQAVIEGRQRSVDEERAKILLKMIDAVTVIEPKFAINDIKPLVRQLSENAEAAYKADDPLSAAHQAEFAVYAYERLRRLEPLHRIPRQLQMMARESLKLAIDSYFQLADEARGREREGDHTDTYTYAARAAALINAVPQLSEQERKRMLLPYFELQKSAEMHKETVAFNDISREANMRFLELRGTPEARLARTVKES